MAQARLVHGLRLTAISRTQARERAQRRGEAPRPRGSKLDRILFGPVGARALRADLCHEVAAHVEQGVAGALRHDAEKLALQPGVDDAVEVAIKKAAEEAEKKAREAKRREARRLEQERKAAEIRSAKDNMEREAKQQQSKDYTSKFYLPQGGE